MGAAVDVIGTADAATRWLVVCDHASNAFPPPWGDLGLSQEAQAAHIAWDPGALGVAGALAGRLRAPLVAARISRLVYDLNRPPHADSAVATTSDRWQIPGNRGLSLAERLARTEAVYLPFHAALSTEIARALTLGARPALVAVHSFTPVWNGRPRAVELGVIHDTDPALAHAVAESARRLTGLTVAVNEPYSAADGVTHTLALHATPYRLPNVMLEIRNDLIATPDAETAMAATLSLALGEALDRISAASRGAA
jgi:predicted N-formylglutamate amidohydrolase